MLVYDLVRRFRCSHSSHHFESLDKQIRDTVSFYGQPSDFRIRVSHWDLQQFRRAQSYDIH